ncbi:MAG: RNase adapter RapZ [Gammaproteobacteria bacterium]|jgi:UPF0042 nucleotide-binding protein
MRLIIVSGLSGSGKSVALRLLEDLDFYCVDNIPARLLRAFITEMANRDDYVFENIGVGFDVRSHHADMAEVAERVRDLRRSGTTIETIFLQADTNVILKRFRETHRKHPLTDQRTSLEEAIAKERELLGPVQQSADLIVDTSVTNIYELREQIRNRIVPRDDSAVSIQIESFGYKHGLPANADFVFDVRCLPNPYWRPELQMLNGKDKAVIDFLDTQPLVQEMIDDVAEFLSEWIPRYKDFQRAYLTIAIGCTGGQHRSVYITEAVAKRLGKTHGNIRIRHNELPDPDVMNA